MAGRAPLKLYTIPFSHYCEAARWSLQINKVSFEETPALPVLHLVLLPRKECGGKGTPFAQVTADGTWLNDSWSIIRTCFPDDPIDEELRETLDKDVGISARAILYSYVLGTPFVDDLCGQATFGQRTAWWLFGGLAANLMRKGLVRSPEYIAKCEERVIAALPAIESKLGLSGLEDADWDLSPSASKIAACALFAPLVCPADFAYGTGFQLSMDEATYPKGLPEMLAKYRATTLGRFTLKFYAANRRASL